MARTLFLWLAILVFGVLLGVYLVPDPDTVARRVRAERPQPKTIVRETRRGPAMRSEIAGQIRRAYAERAKEPIPEDLLEAALAEVDGELRGGLAARLAGEARDHEARRLVFGTLSEPVDVLLQARGGHNVTLLAHPREVASTPLASDAAGSRAAYARGTGAIPPGKVLILEEAELDAVLGVERSGGSVRICLGTDTHNQRDLHLALRVRMVGRAIIRPGSERRVSLRADRAAASLRLRGRLVGPEEAAGLRPERFRWITEGGTGLVGARPVVIQVVADHGGGNPRRAAIDGSDNGRFDGRVSDDLWDEQMDTGALRRSLVRFEGEGLVPPGKVYVLRRVEYRARLTPEKGDRSDFVVTAGKHRIVETDATKGARSEGVWEGEVRIEPGRESDVHVTMHYFGIGEARFFGELIDSG